MALRLCGSTPTVGSSRIRMSGSWTSAAAMLRRRFMPPLKVEGLSLARSARPTSASAAATRSAQQRAGEAVERAEELEVGGGAEVLVDRELLRHDADAPLGRLAVLGQPLARGAFADEHLAAVGARPGRRASRRWSTCRRRSARAGRRSRRRRPRATGRRRRRGCRTICRGLGLRASEFLVGRQRSATLASGPAPRPGEATDRHRRGANGEHAARAAGRNDDANGDAGRVRGRVGVHRRRLEAAVGSQGLDVRLGLHPLRRHLRRRQRLEGRVLPPRRPPRPLLRQPREAAHEDPVRPRRGAADPARLRARRRPRRCLRGDGLHPRRATARRPRSAPGDQSLLRLRAALRLDRLAREAGARASTCTSASGSGSRPSRSIRRSRTTTGSTWCSRCSTPTTAAPTPAASSTPHGNVAEGPGFNVFMVKDGVVRTADRGVLEGISRKTVIELCGALAIPLRVDAGAGARSSAAADEVFLSSTGGGVLPIAKIDGRPLAALAGAAHAAPAGRLLGAARRSALPRSDRALTPARRPGDRRRGARPPRLANRGAAHQLGSRACPAVARRSADSSRPAGGVLFAIVPRTEFAHEQPAPPPAPRRNLPARPSPPIPTRSPRWSSASPPAPSPCAAGAARSATAVVWQPGLVVTAAHVFRRTPAAITLVGAEGQSVEATLVGLDSSTDIALFRLAVTDGAAFPPVATGDAAGVRAGHCRRRRRPQRRRRRRSPARASSTAPPAPWQTWLGGSLDRLIRLDGGVYDGLSGAPVADARGAVIGVATAALSRSYGIVVPTSTVARVVAALLANGHVARPWLGIGAQPVPVAGETGERGRGDDRPAHLLARPRRPGRARRPADRRHRRPRRRPDRRRPARAARCARRARRPGGDAFDPARRRRPRGARSRSASGRTERRFC